MRVRARCAARRGKGISAASAPRAITAATGARLVETVAIPVAADPSVPAYTASKTGIVGLTRALAHQWGADGIRVNAIAPGYIDTDMVAAVPEEALKKIIGTIPVGRLGKAEEIASAVSFLASEGSGFMTGSCGR